MDNNGKHLIVCDFFAKTFPKKWTHKKKTNNLQIKKELNKSSDKLPKIAKSIDIFIEISLVKKTVSKARNKKTSNYI